MKHIICAVIGVLCVYLLGSFFEVSFDIAQWSRETRVMVTLFMPFGAIVGVTVSLEEL